MTRNTSILIVLWIVALGCSRAPTVVTSTATVSKAESVPASDGREHDDHDGHSHAGHAHAGHAHAGHSHEGHSHDEAQTVDSEGAEDSSKPKPIAVLEDGVYNFGSMEPYTRRQHKFTVRNEGDAPLTLREGHSSCKCTIGEVGDESIPPGGESTILLSWRSAEGSQLFAHEAEIITNDPDNPILTCRVEGRILSQLVADPGAFSMTGIIPGVAEQATVTLTSQTWESFEVLDISCGMEGSSWTFDRLSQEDLERLSVNDGYRITFQVPDDLPRGYFKDNLSIRVLPKGADEITFELPIKGNVLRRVSIYGKGIDSRGVVKLGKITQGKGLKKAFSVKVRDSEPTLAIKKIETNPDWLEVSFEVYDEAKGLYRMFLEIPKTAPRAAFMGELGKLHIEFENPRFEDIDLDVEFAILGEGDF